MYRQQTPMFVSCGYRTMLHLQHVPSSRRNTGVGKWPWLLDQFGGNQRSDNNLRKKKKLHEASNYLFGDSKGVLHLMGTPVLKLHAHLDGVEVIWCLKRSGLGKRNNGKLMTDGWCIQSAIELNESWTSCSTLPRRNRSIAPAFSLTGIEWGGKSFYKPRVRVRHAGMRWCY